MDLAEATSKMRERVGENSGLNATVKFDFGDGGVIYVDGESAPNSVSNEDKEAQCTISISFADFIAMGKGELDAMTAFMMGKLKVAGDMGVAMKLQKVL
jgi:putative sterol carrier protein